MKSFLRYCNWELENEYKTSGYFCVMVFCYGISELIYGNKEIDIVMLFEMFLLNYFIVLVHRVVLKDDIGYNNRAYYIRATGLLFFSVIAIVITFHIFGWFRGFSLGGKIFLYVCMISSYLFIWIMDAIKKTTDTKLLNEQLADYKKRIIKDNINS